VLEPNPLADLTQANTLALRAQAARLVRLTALTDVPAVADLPGPVFILGGGSNVVLPPQMAGTVVKVELRGIREVASGPKGVILEAGAGESWHDFVAYGVARGLGGLENLALIPGTVGAAPVQNIGAYGLEISERIVGVTTYDLKAHVWQEWTPQACAFAYRDSAFKRAEPGRWLITAVRVRLPHRWQPRLDYPDLRRHPAWADTPPTPAAVFDAVCAIRRAKLPDPGVLPNAGSFFKNPVVDVPTYRTIAASHASLPAWPQADGSVKLAAAWLIEQAGWKGRRLGPVGMHERHALVLVNHGGANADDVLRLSEAVQTAVRARFGVALEREPVLPAAS